LVVQRCHARVGILGNPSDGYAGKTISTTIGNFEAIVTLRASTAIKFLPNAMGDRDTFTSIDDFVDSISKDGYDGGIKLLMATTKIFTDALEEEDIVLDERLKRGFTVSYTTDVPRQLGLAGSSAICTATFRALMEWHAVPPSFIPPERLAGYVLRAEQQELGIAAGLQDRVSQAFDQPVFMNFTPEAFAANEGKHGQYETFPADVAEWLQGKLFLLFPTEGSALAGKSSGKVHSPVRKRWEEGDPVIRKTMMEIAELAEQGRRALVAHDENALVRLMNENFQLRLSIFKDAVAQRDKQMIDIARSCGENVAAKLPGSGGAVLAFTSNGNEFKKGMAAHKDIHVIELIVRHPARKRAKLASE
jgi:glucuronokinase